MKNREFLERMIFLTQKMTNVYNADPIDQKALDEVRKEIYDAGQRFDCTYRHKRWTTRFTYIALILFVLWLVYMLLSEL